MSSDEAVGADAGAGPDGEERDESPSLEKRLERLDEIVLKLEAGDVKLEEGLDLFEEGVRHIRRAEELLSRAEMRVEELIGGTGDLRVRRFEGEGE